MTPRYAVSLALGSAAALAPVAAVLVALLGVYAYRPNEPAPTFALTALLCAGLSAWLEVALLRAEPDSTRELRRTLLGGARALRSQAVTSLLIATALTAVFLVWPLATGAFEPRPSGGDLMRAAAGHAAASVWGSAAAAFAVGVAGRRAGYAGAVVVGVFALTAVGAGLTAAAGGPLALADAISSRSDADTTAAVLATLAWATALVASTAWVTVRRG